jgi:hypothetical protein
VDEWTTINWNQHTLDLINRTPCHSDRHVAPDMLLAEIAHQFDVTEQI